ncbi:MAG: hypothetical protein HY226_04790 [Candidatus Vogelbacteria bacterium]|nr:hypothetical protein [Candidatus Vogelbacteria bacterium]
MEKISSKIEQKREEGFSSIVSKVGPKYYEEWKEKKESKSNPAEHIYFDTTGKLMSKGYTLKTITNSVYLDALVEEFVPKGEKINLSGMEVSQVEDLIYIMESLIAVNEKPSEQILLADMLQGLEGIKMTPLLGIIRQLTDVGYALDERLVDDIDDSILTFSLIGDQIKKYERLLEPENISKIFGLAKALELALPLETALALDLLEFSGGLENFRRYVPNGDLALIPDDLATLYQRLNIKAKLKYKLESSKGLDETCHMIFSLATFSCIAKAGKIDMSPVYKGLSRPSQIFERLRDNFIMPFPELLEDHIEKVFWEMWNLPNEYDTTKHLLLEKLEVDPHSAVENIISKLRGDAPQFFSVAKDYPKIIDEMTDERDKRFAKLVLEISGYKRVYLPESIDVVSRDSLIDMVESLGGVSTFKQMSRVKILEYVRILSADFRPLILKGIVNIDYDEDDETYSRSGVVSKRRSRAERGVGVEGSDEFTESIKLQGLSEPNINRILYCRDYLRSFANLPEKSFGLMSNHDDVTSLNTLLERGRSHARSIMSDLDDSVKEFDILHRKLDKTRSIPSFTLLWSKRIAEYFESSLLSSLTEKSPMSSVQVNGLIERIYVDCYRLFSNGIELYKKESRDIIPRLKEMNDFVNKKLFTKGVWFSGRDGVPLRLAVKARYFGGELEAKSDYAGIIRRSILADVNRRGELIELAKRERLSNQEEMTINEEILLEEGMNIYLATDVKINDLSKMALISRLLVDNIKTPEQKKLFIKYFEELGINSEMFALDTGYSGSVIRDAFKIINGHESDQYAKKISLLSKGGKNVSGGPSKYITQILDDGVAGKATVAIEGLPKPTDRYLFIDEETGKPVAIPNDEDIKLLSWVAEHCIMRHLAPRPPKDKLALRLDAQRYIANDLATIEGLNQKVEAADPNRVLELYDVAAEKIGQVFVAFADSLLKKASIVGENAKILFLARDSLATYESAKILLERFPERYPGVSSKDLVYAYLSRKVLVNNSEQDIHLYMAGELGFGFNDRVIISDIGMYGTAVEPIKNVLKNNIAAGVESVDFLISRNAGINGFLDDYKKPLQSLEQIPGNPIVHFLEDTFSGEIKSPNILEYSKLEKKWLPTSEEAHYPRFEALKRRAAIWGVRDYAETVSTADLNSDIDRQALDKFFLENLDKLKELGVPHER